MTARYWVAQHIPDLFRNEPRNIGVVVQLGDALAARFFGETDESQLDGRKLRAFTHPEVYRQWVEYWRNEVAKGTPDLLAEASGSHYRLVSGGHVVDTEPDSVHDVLDYLYAVLVSEGGLREALATQAELQEQSVSPLEQDILKEFLAQEILADGNELWIPHPVRCRVQVRGQKVAYTPPFVQENRLLYVMEIIDFTTRHKQWSRDHAGWAAYMFHDVRGQRPNTDAIAIVRATDVDRENEDVGNGLAVLQNEGRVIDWSQPSERSSFLDERKHIAHGG